MPGCGVLRHALAPNGMAHPLLEAGRQAMNIVPTAAIVAAESSFVTAMPLQEPAAGANPAVAPLAGKTPAAAARFVLCLTTALATPPMAKAPVEQNQVAGAPIALKTGPFGEDPLNVQPPPLAQRAAPTTPLPQSQVVLPPLTPETEQVPVATDPAPALQPPVQANQVTAPAVVLATEQLPLAKVAPKAPRSAEPVQRRAAPSAVPPAAPQLSAPATPTVPIPAAVAPDASSAPQPPADHGGEATTAPASRAVAPAPLAPASITLAAIADKPLLDTPVAIADKPPVDPPPPSAMFNKEPDAASPTQPAPASLASPPPAVALAPDAVTPMRLEPAPTAPATPAHAAPSPVAQLAPAMVALSTRPDGTSTLTLRLQPPELGQVHIAIERPQDAPPRVDITVERSETLTLLMRDQPQLQRALDQAGVPSDGRSLTFHLATEPSARPETPVFATPSGAAAYAGDDRRGPPREPVQPQSQPQREAAADQPDQNDIVQPPIWLRAGLDITA